MNRTLQLFSASLLTLFQIPMLSAASLGEARLLSKLGEPLHMTIQISGTEDLRDDELELTLKAIEEDPATIKALRKKSININDTTNGKIATVTGEDPVREPYLHFKVTLQKAQGSISRDYVLMLDL